MPVDGRRVRGVGDPGVPYVGQLGCRVERFEPGCVDVRLPATSSLLRPGGTICGPALMALADITLYGVVLSLIGRVELAVTTDLNIHFLAKPGRRLHGPRPHPAAGPGLAVGEVTIVGAAPTGRWPMPPAPTPSRRPPVHRHQHNKQAAAGGRLARVLVARAGWP